MVEEVLLGLAPKMRLSTDMRVMCKLEELWDKHPDNKRPGTYEMRRQDLFVKQIVFLFFVIELKGATIQGGKLNRTFCNIRSNLVIC